MESETLAGLFYLGASVSVLFAVTSLAKPKPDPSESFKGQTPWRTEFETVGDIQIERKFYLERKALKLRVNLKTGMTDESFFTWRYHEGRPQECDYMVQ